MIRSNPPRSSGEPPSASTIAKAFGLLVLLGVGFIGYLWLTGRG